MPRLRVALRFVVSFVVAGALVLTAAGLAIRYFTGDKYAPAKAFVVPGVRYIDLKEHPEILKMLRDKQGRDESKTPPPPPSEPARQVSGFVQVAYTVNPDGSVSDVKVIGAVPAGYYEREARRIVSARHYQPEVENGKAVAHRETDVIHFTVSSTHRSGDGSNPNG
ncbi:MAG: TonB family protein [Gammaproteobacteria bacterium]